MLFPLLKTSYEVADDIISKRISHSLQRYQLLECTITHHPPSSPILTRPLTLLFHDQLIHPATPTPNQPQIHNSFETPPHLRRHPEQRLLPAIGSRVHLPEIQAERGQQLHLSQTVP